METATKFIDLLKLFYKDTDCKSFFESNKDYYATAESKFHSIFKKLNVDWYYKLYGKLPNENFNIIIGLGNGGNNFGPNIALPNKPRNLYAIIGASTFDDNCLPIFEEEDYLPTLIHEFNHSFINHLTEIFSEELQHSAKIIFDKERIKMKRLAYENWSFMLNEALVRASVIRYLISHDSDTTKIDLELKGQLANGFVWMKELVELLKECEDKRDCKLPLKPNCLKVE